jgi:hypothetical protein
MGPIDNGAFWVRARNTKPLKLSSAAHRWGRRQKHGSWRRQTRENVMRRIEEDRDRDLWEMMRKPTGFYGTLN